jgi:hypothetical protein
VKANFPASSRPHRLVRRVSKMTVNIVGEDSKVRVSPCQRPLAERDARPSSQWACSCCNAELNTRPTRIQPTGSMTAPQHMTADARLRSFRCGRQGAIDRRSALCSCAPLDSR